MLQLRTQILTLKIFENKEAKNLTSHSFSRRHSHSKRAEMSLRTRGVTKCNAKLPYEF